MAGYLEDLHEVLRDKKFRFPDERSNGIIDRAAELGIPGARIEPLESLESKVSPHLVPLNALYKIASAPNVKDLYEPSRINFKDLASSVLPYPGPVFEDEMQCLQVQDLNVGKDGNRSNGNANSLFIPKKVWTSLAQEVQLTTAWKLILKVRNPSEAFENLIQGMEVTLSGNFRKLTFALRDRLGRTFQEECPREECPGIPGRLVQRILVPGKLVHHYLANPEDRTIYFGSIEGEFVHQVLCALAWVSLDLDWPPPPRNLNRILKLVAGVVEQHDLARVAPTVVAICAGWGGNSRASVYTDWSGRAAEAINAIDILVWATQYSTLTKLGKCIGGGPIGIGSSGATRISEAFLGPGAPCACGSALCDLNHRLTSFNPAGKLDLYPFVMQAVAGSYRIGVFGSFASGMLRFIIKSVPDAPNLLQVTIIDRFCPKCMQWTEDLDCCGKDLSGPTTQLKLKRGRWIVKDQLYTQLVLWKCGTCTEKREEDVYYPALHCRKPCSGSKDPHDLCPHCDTRHTGRKFETTFQRDPVIPQDLIGEQEGIRHAL